jgi:hypothetical protein
MRPLWSPIYMSLVQPDYVDFTHYCVDFTHFHEDTIHTIWGFSMTCVDATDPWNPLLGISGHPSDYF